MLKFRIADKALDNYIQLREKDVKKLAKAIQFVESTKSVSYLNFDLGFLWFELTNTKYDTIVTVKKNRKYNKKENENYVELC